MKPPRAIRWSRGAAFDDAPTGPEPPAGGEDYPLVPRGGRWQRLTTAHPLVVDSGITLLLVALATAGLVHRDRDAGRRFG